MAVVSFDSDSNCRQLFINQADTETIGRSQIALLGKLMGYKGEFAILSAASTATNQNAWIKYMKLELKKPRYENMKLVKIYYGNDNPAQSLQATESMLQAYPNLKGIESPTTVGISSAAQFLSNSKKYKGKIALTGLGLPSQMKKYVYNNTVKEFALWNPEDLGYLAGYAVSAIADGKITGKVGQKFTAGKLGKYTIIKGADGKPQVILGPPFVFNKKNVGEVQLLDRSARGAAVRGAPRPSAENTDATRVLSAPGEAREDGRVSRAACCRLARDAGGTRLDGLAQLLALPVGHRHGDRLSRVRRLRGCASGHGANRGERALAGRDGRVLRGTRRASPRRGPPSAR